MSPTTFDHEMKKFDRHLRLRKSKLGSWYFIERKARRETRAVPKPVYTASIDRWIRDTQGYVLVTRLFSSQLTKSMLLELRRCDMWEKRHGRFGAEGMFEEELRQEQAQEAKLDKMQSDKIQDVSAEAYDRQMSRQGDVVYPGLKGMVAGGKK